MTANKFDPLNDIQELINSAVNATGEDLDL
jgi:hypothetical protein